MSHARSLTGHVAVTLALLGAVALGAAPAASAAVRTAPGETPAATTPVVLTCAGTDVARPARITTTCADGYTYFEPITWSSWGRASATATTRFHENPCMPSCVDSKEVSYSATLSLSGLTSAHGKRFYTKLRAAYLVGKAHHSYAFTLSTSR